MSDRGILDGDFVLVSPSAAPKDGDIVCARIGPDATVKVLAHNGSNVVLNPAHAGEQSIEIGPNDDFAILGVVCGVFRPFWEQEPTPTISTDDAPVS
jgi:repressor LexA